MKILAIDTTSSLFSLCLLNGDDYDCIEYDAGVSHSSRILKEIQKILSSNNIEISELDGIAFSAGPGSFTGVRIASSVSYGLAYPFSIPIIPVNTLEVIASMASNEFVLATIDARMKQIYFQLFKTHQDKSMTTLTEPQVLSPEDLPKLSEQTQKNLTIIGSGLTNYPDHFRKIYANFEFKKANIKQNQSYYLARRALLKTPFKFSLKNINPHYVRNKVAFTIDERQKKRS